MENSPVRLSIKELAVDDRPREKMLKKGAESLSNAELIAILIGSGNSKETAVDLAQRILNDNNNNLSELSLRKIPQLTRYNGIGEAKAISIAAAMEIGRRRSLEKAMERPCIKSSTDAYETLRGTMEDLDHEEVWALYLNRANKVISRERISSGGIAASVIDVKLIMRQALTILASAIIVAHNHPSGSLNPSEQDKDSTRKIKKACEYLDIKLLDHIVIGKGEYYSFNDKSIL